MSDTRPPDLRDLLKRHLALKAAMAKHPGYHPDAYLFVCAGVDYTCGKLGGRRDVSGPELVDGLCDMAVECFGFLAPQVLEHWGVKSAEDFGEIVFALVEAGLLGKSPRDSQADFRGLPALRETLRQRYRINVDVEV